jgi:hypothetical protein
MEIITSGTAVIKTLPSGETFNIEMIDGWDELSASQRAYLHAYMDSIGQVNMARMISGISKSLLEEWGTQPGFAHALEMIEDLFTDGLRALDYMESITNGKIRGRVLQARKAKGYEPKTTKQTNVLIGAGGLGNIVRQLSQPSESSE